MSFGVTMMMLVFLISVANLCLGYALAVYLRKSPIILDDIEDDPNDETPSNSDRRRPSRRKPKPKPSKDKVNSDADEDEEGDSSESAEEIRDEEDESDKSKKVRKIPRNRRRRGNAVAEDEQEKQRAAVDDDDDQDEKVRPPIEEADEDEVKQRPIIDGAKDKADKKRPAVPAAEEDEEKDRPALPPEDEEADDEDRPAATAEEEDDEKDRPPSSMAEEDDSDDAAPAIAESGAGSFSDACMDVLEDLERCDNTLFDQRDKPDGDIVQDTFNELAARIGSGVAEMKDAAGEAKDPELGNQLMGFADAFSMTVSPSIDMILDLTYEEAALPAYLEQAHEISQKTVETMKKLVKKLDEKLGIGTKKK
ncbi:MAG: antitoxin component of RelBE/YafQ-DinJ toxin-antitoxin module [Pirellulaceae bacterium]|jgi:antitoxin component of RelBE/YafQ-DinJ toxin-antitoxin module